MYIIHTYNKTTIILHKSSDLVCYIRETRGREKMCIVYDKKHSLLDHTECFCCQQAAHWRLKIVRFAKLSKVHTL